MKMKPEHYEEIAEKIDYFIENNASSVTAHYMKHRFQRFAWDVFNAAYRGNRNDLYSYLNDTHIETALKSILKRHEFTA